MRDASDGQDILIFPENQDQILEIGRVVQDGRVSKHREASNVNKHKASHASRDVRVASGKTRHLACHPTRPPLLPCMRNSPPRGSNGNI